MSMIKLFQIIKKMYRVTCFNLKKRYERYQNMRARSQGPKTEGCIIGLGNGDQINLIALFSNKNNQSDILTKMGFTLSKLYEKHLY